MNRWFDDGINSVDKWTEEGKIGLMIDNVGCLDFFYRSRVSKVLIRTSETAGNQKIRFFPIRRQLFILPSSAIEFLFS